MDTVLKAIGGYTALAAFVALVTGDSSWDGKFGDVFYILIGMYTAFIPSLLLGAGIVGLAERLEFELPDMTENQTAFLFGVTVFGLGLVSRYTFLDASTRHPTHAAAIAGAVLLAVPFVIIGFRKLGTPPNGTKVAAVGARPVTAQTPQTGETVTPNRVELCPACGHNNRIPQPGLLACGNCGTRFVALQGGGVQKL